MKKIIPALVCLLIITGCSENTANDNETNNEDVVFNEVKLDDYPFVTLNINPSIKIYYDDNHIVIGKEYLNDDASNAWSDTDIDDMNLNDAVTKLIDVAEEKEYINENNLDVEVILDNEDLQEELSTSISEYVNNNDLDIKVSLGNDEQTTIIEKELPYYYQDFDVDYASSLESDEELVEYIHYFLGDSEWYGIGEPSFVPWEPATTGVYIVYSETIDCQMLQKISKVAALYFDGKCKYGASSGDGRSSCDASSRCSISFN